MLLILALICLLCRNDVCWLNKFKAYSNRCWTTSWWRSSRNSASIILDSYRKINVTFTWNILIDSIHYRSRPSPAWYCSSLSLSQSPQNELRYFDLNRIEPILSCSTSNSVSLVALNFFRNYQYYWINNYSTFITQPSCIASVSTSLHHRFHTSFAQ